MKRALQIGAAAAFAILLGLTIGRFPWWVSTALAVLPIFALFASRKELFLALPIVFLHTQLYVPGIPGNFNLHHLLIVLFIGHICLTRAIKKEPQEFRFHPELLLILFMGIWILALMIFRGSGMRVLGSTEMGGGTYIQILLTLLYYGLARNEALSPRSLRWMGIAIGVSGILPLLAQGAYELSGGTIWLQMYFFQFGAAQGDTANMIAKGALSRLTFLSHGTSLIWVGIFFPQSRRSVVKLIPSAFLLVGTACAVMSGYRGAALSTLGFVWLYLFHRSKKRIVFTALSSAFAILLYLVFMLTAPALPFALQRVLSSVPGIPVSWEAHHHGLGTLLWRQSVWNLVIQDIPKYFWFGRGLTFNPAMLDWMEFHTHSPHVAYTIGSFHQASLELLVLLGAPAFAACLGFYILVIRKGQKILAVARWRRVEVRDWAAAVLLFILVRTILGFLGGTLKELLAELPLWILFFHLIRNTDLQADES